MPITYEKIEALIEEKFQEALKPLTKQIEDVMKNIKFTSEKYNEIVRLLKANDKERKTLMAENKSIKAKVLESENEIKLLKESCNDMDQYLRRDCVEIRGLSVSSEQGRI
jgi:HEAT repeat protein